MSGEPKSRAQTQDTRKAGADAPEAPPREADPPTEPTEEPEERFSTEDLIAAARTRLGVSPIAASGALAQSPRKTHTLAQAQALVAQFKTLEIS